jgi:hypothetical protein
MPTQDVNVDIKVHIISIINFKFLFTAGPCEVISEEPFVNIEVVKAGRDPNKTFSPGTVVKVTCGKGYGLNIGANITAKCVRGQWKPAKPECLICKETFLFLII